MRSSGWFQLFLTSRDARAQAHALGGTAWFAAFTHATSRAVASTTMPEAGAQQAEAESMAGQLALTRAVAISHAQEAAREVATEVGRRGDRGST